MSSFCLCCTGLSLEMIRSPLRLVEEKLDWIQHFHGEYLHSIDAVLEKILKYGREEFMNLMTIPKFGRESAFIHFAAGLSRLLFNFPCDKPPIFPAGNTAGYAPVAGSLIGRDSSWPPVGGPNIKLNTFSDAHHQFSLPQ